MYDHYNSFNTFEVSPHVGSVESMMSDIAIGVLIFAAVLYFILFACIITSYVLRSTGLYRICKKNGVSNPWLAWIPVGNLYVLGKAAGEVSFGKKTVKNMPLWLILIEFIGVAVIIGFYIGFVITLIVMAVMAEISAAEIGAVAIVGICMFVCFIISAIVYSALRYIFYGMAYFTLCKKYKSTQRSVFYLLMALFVPLADAIIIFKLGRLDAPACGLLTANEYAQSKTENNAENNFMGE